MKRASNHYVYVLFDGIKSKVGITNDVEKRMKSYATHNSNSRVYRVLCCRSKEDALRIENSVLSFFADKRKKTSREWIDANPHAVFSLVDFLGAKIQADPLYEKQMSLCPSDEFERLRYRYHEHPNRDYLDDIVDCFALEIGAIPGHRLPQDIRIIDAFPVGNVNDLCPTCYLRDAVTKHALPIVKHNDHKFKFYQLLPTNAGYVAMCSHMAVMPYVKAVEGYEIEIDRLKHLGLRCQRNDSWSWWNDQCAFFLITGTNRRSLFDRSFRKWAIEQDVNETECQDLFDVAHDPWFPLDVTTQGELFDRYLARYFGISEEKSSDYRNWFDQWRAQQNA